MEFRRMKLSELTPASYNPRKKLKPGDPEFEKLRKSIETFGLVDPPIWNSQTNTVIGGHQRLSVLEALGETECDVVVVDLPPVQERALNVALNKVSGEWDIPLLTDLLRDLTESDFDATLTGFDAAEIEKLFGSNDVTDDDFDVDKALEESPFVQLGDLWTLGRHRLLCGDATKLEDVSRLMGDKRANLALVDPPYGCDYTGGTGMKILNDTLKGEEFYKFLYSAFKNLYDNLADGGAFYCFHSDAEKVNFYNATVNAGFHYSTTCVWEKNSLVLGRMDYQMIHEPVIYSFKDTAAHKWYSDRKQTTIWKFDRPTKSKFHPTQKPLDLLAYPIKNSSQANGIVLDTFGGSGSTLIVCEQTDRICNTMELDPKYASAIVTRFAELKGSGDITVERGGEVIDFANIAERAAR
ncbi:adenine methyltransferase [Clostridia bacterium]|nr:adenine methyltransferase [Clostridia bacterium]